MPGNRGFDGRGNFAMGMKEQIVFPEINYDRVDTVRGMDIQFVTTAKTDKEAKALLKAFDLPLRQLNPFGKPPGTPGQVPEDLGRHGQDLVCREEQPPRPDGAASPHEACCPQGGGDGP
jgi:hypothetical protein